MQTPAPNSFDPTQSKWFKPGGKITIKSRITKKTDNMSDTPGPTDYNLDKSIP